MHWYLYNTTDQMSRYYHQDKFSDGMYPPHILMEPVLIQLCFSIQLVFLTQQKLLGQKTFVILNYCHIFFHPIHY